MRRQTHYIKNNHIGGLTFNMTFLNFSSTLYAHGILGLVLFGEHCVYSKQMVKIGLVVIFG